MPMANDFPHLLVLVLSLACSVLVWAILCAVARKRKNDQD